MFNKKLYRVILTWHVLVLPLLSYADNTEIYFNSKQEAVKPNVLFILDRSTSMDSDPRGYVIVNNEAQDYKTHSKLNLLKEAFQLIMAKDAIGGYRVGVMDYGSGYPNLAQEVVDIDELDHSRDIDYLNPVKNGDTTTWSQPVWISTDDGYQNGITQNNWLDFTYGDLDAAYISLNNTRYFAYRFDNILLKPAIGSNGSGLSAPDYGIESAKLSVFLYSPYLSSVYYKKRIEILIDPAVDSQYLRPRTKNDLSSRYNAASADKSKYRVVCNIPEAYHLDMYDCDVTDLVRQQIARDGWKGGNAITFILRNATIYIPTAVAGNIDPNTGEKRSDLIPYMGYLRFKEWTNGSNQAYLKITAKNAAIAENKRTKKETLLDKVFAIVTLGATETNNALLMAAQYISNIPGPYSLVNKGPYHSDGYGKYYVNNKVVALNKGVQSPLTSGCQLTHFVLMSDGQPTASYEPNLKYYMGYNVGSICQVDGVNEKTGTVTENCGRQLVRWLTQTDNSSLSGPNYIHTHAIGFGMVDDDKDPDKDNVQFGPNSAPVLYLRDLASYGKGQFHTTTNIEGLVDAFRSIINEALSISTTAVSGQVLSSASSSFDQRKEVFYTFYQSGLKDYWPGNLKGFKMKYEKVDINGQTGVEIPVLYSWSDTGMVQAIDALGKFKAVDSAWSEGMGDGANAEAGGVVNKIPDEANLPTRKLYTAVSGGELIDVSSSSTQITSTDLALTSADDDKKKGLLDFMRGYVYALGGNASAEGTGSARIKKQGDSIASGVSLVSYGCDNSDTSLLNCDFDNLNLVGLLASNDGVFRAYNLATGEALYEFMPKEMLPIIKKLQDPATLDESYVDDTGKLVKKAQIKTYGLDGNVVIYHEDTNKDSFINNGEKAYAYLASGRGGAYLYAFDISDKNSVKLKWTKTTNELSSLGEAWSEPVIGKVNINGIATPVIIFGAGYDSQQNDASRGLAYDSVGNGVYMLNADTGTIIWSINNLPYSVPGGVAIYTKTQTGADGTEETYINDIFFGDMGGQLWRFHINNGKSEANLIKAVGNNEGVIASISGNNKNTHRRFYQKPFVYNLTDDGVTDMLAINIGTGYKAHPLVTKNEDRFYSFRVPESIDKAYDQPIKEDDLGVLTLDSTGGDHVKGGASIAKGFVVELEGTVGEKVLSNSYTIGGKVVFSTYIPDNSFDTSTCVPNTGKQRTYSLDIVTGKNLLKTAYVETSISGMPSDTALYCGERYCSLVTGVAMLDGDKSKYEGYCIGDDCTSPLHYDKGEDNTQYVKTGWTDIFSL